MGDIKTNNVGCVVWMTGYSGSGKTTLANSLKLHLSTKNINSVIIDGDEIRKKYNHKLTFTDDDRVLNSQYIIQEVNSQKTDVVIVSIISPFERIRVNARTKCKADVFLETYVNSSLEICEIRDTKGLYKKARSGEVLNFTGISSDYQKPVNSDIIVDTESYTAEESGLYLFKKVYSFISK